MFLEFIETLLGLLQLVPLRLQLALELLLRADLGVETILKRKKSKLLKNGALPIAKSVILYKIKLPEKIYQNHLSTNILIHYI